MDMTVNMHMTMIICKSTSSFQKNMRVTGGGGGGDEVERTVLSVLTKDN